MKIKSEKGMASLFGMGMILSIILGISLGIYTSNSANATIRSATSALETQDDIISSANAAKESSVIGNARDALTTALSSISSNHFSSNTEVNLYDELTVSALSKEMKDYHISSVEYDDDNGEFEVEFEDNKGNEFIATVSKYLILYDIEKK